MTGRLRRLARMRPAELRFRATDLTRTAREFVEYSTGRARWRREILLDRLEAGADGLPHVRGALHARDWLQAERALRTHFRTRSSRFPINPARWEAIAAQIRAEFPDAAPSAVARANKVLAGRFDLLGYEDLTFGDDREIDWHLDPVHNRRPPVAFWRGVPYLDPQNGDHKIIWELNRHQHWLTLGRAAWLTGDRRYLAPYTQQLEGWMAANPPLTGVNWASMLELALRVLSWLWALHFLVAVDREKPRKVWVLDLLIAIERQLDHVADHLSTYFSPNTHLLGEALALYVGGRVLPELKAAKRWTTLGRAVLLQETTAQVHSDGGHAELSAHYHRYALDFYMLALVIARKTGDQPSATAFEEVIERMAIFCRAIANESGTLPLLGDDDGGLLFPMCGRSPIDARDSLSLAASLLYQPELAISGPTEEALWMLGGDRAALARPEAIAAPPSQLFPETGYAVVRSRGEHLVFDVGRHGFANGGHAHADALSIVLSVGGDPFLIDPGTATYTMDPSTRDRFRSTRMHNSVAIDGRPQSAPAGPFHWRTRANARPDLWRAGSAFDYVEGSHDGYTEVAHRRAIFATREGLWFIVDHLVSDDDRERAVEVFWHIDPSWKAHWSDASCAQMLHRSGRWAALASTLPFREQFEGDAEGLGWVAPVYGQLRPAIALRYSGTASRATSYLTVIATAESPRDLAAEAMPVSTDTPDEWHRVGALVTFGQTRYVALFATPLVAGADRHVSQVDASMPLEAGAPRREFTLATDARVALLKLSGTGAPLALSLVDGRAAIWSGDPGVTLSLPAAAADLHLDIAAQRRLSRAGGTQRLG